MTTMNQIPSALFLRPTYPVPFNVLYMRAEKKPPTLPKRMNSTKKAVMKLPRLAGERNPKAAKEMVEKDIQKHWMPLPITTENSKGQAGGEREGERGSTNENNEDNEGQ